MHEESWFDKQFELGLPLADMPALIERLRSVPSEIERAIAGASPKTLTAQSGEWSVLQHIGHLADLEELHDGRLDDFEADVDGLRAADLSNRKTEEANHNAASVSDLLSTLRSVRANFVKRLEELSEETQARSIRHPRLQKSMRPVDLAYFVTEHDAHHVAAIKRLCAVSKDEKV